jgi:hypothetical protein
MRRLLPALLLAACITDRPPPSAPTVWYSVAPLPSPPRVGTVDRGRMVRAYYDSALFHETTRALARERARAEAAGDERQVSVLRLQERNLQDLRERQLRGERGLTNIILALDSRLALVAQARGVDVIVEDGTWTAEARNIVDVTPQLLELLEAGGDGT